MRHDQHKISSALTQISNLYVPIPAKLANFFISKQDNSCNWRYGNMTQHPVGFERYTKLIKPLHEVTDLVSDCVLGIPTLNIFL